MRDQTIEELAIEECPFLWTKERMMIYVLRRTLPLKIAQDIVDVQPMPNIDLKAIARQPLWQSYWRRHFG